MLDHKLIIFKKFLQIATNLGIPHFCNLFRSIKKSDIRELIFLVLNNYEMVVSEMAVSHFECAKIAITLECAKF